jgi:hypothetical protein
LLLADEFDRGQVKLFVQGNGLGQEHSAQAGRVEGLQVGQLPLIDLLASLEGGNRRLQTVRRGQHHAVFLVIISPAA